MKKSIILVSLLVLVLGVTVISFAADENKPDLRPTQKIMQARLAWLTAMNKNLDGNRLDLIRKDAKDLEEQTRKVSEGLPNPLAKELTLAISTLAKDLSLAAEGNDSATIKRKLGEIKGKCDECHAKIRDKK